MSPPNGVLVPCAWADMHMPAKHAVSGSGQAAHRFSRFSPEYRGRLIKGLSDFQTFCRQEGRCTLNDLLKKPSLADAELSRYVMTRHEESGGVSRSLVKYALLGAQHLSPKLKGHLAASWENMRVWEEKRKTSLRPPLPVPLWCFMTGLARAHSKAAKNVVQ